MPYEIAIASDHQCLLGEGPVWDAHRQEIWWIDILNGEIHRFSPSEGSFRTYPVHELIGCIAPCPNGDWMTATKNGIGRLDSNTGALTHLANPESHLPNNRFNDGKCDPAGRFWAGTMSLSETPGAGSVYCFDQKSIVKTIENVTISNGLAWSADHRTLYYIDTPTMQVVAYQYDKATGVISNKKVIITVPKEDGFPDGMTIDNEGMLWIAHWDGWQVTRWNPETGEKILHIKFPTARITCCTFGGEHLRDLYVTSARTGLSETALREQPLAGSLFVIRNCGFEGLPAFEFKF